MSMSRIRIPHTLVILFSMVVFAQCLTYLIPAGTYDRVETADGQLQVVPGTFHLTHDMPVLPPFASVMAIPKGFRNANKILFFVLIIGGAFAVIRSTGALDAAMGALLRRWSHRPTQNDASTQLTLIPLVSATDPNPLLGWNRTWYNNPTEPNIERASLITGLTLSGELSNG